MIDFWQQTAAELQLPPATVACVVRAAAQYDLPPGLVLSVMKVEGGVDGAVHRNSNGSYDYGLMQINSIWLPKLAPMGFTRDHLVHQPCANVSVAAWIMRQNLDASDHFWQGVGNYHSRNTRANLDYQHKIADAARKLPETWQWWNPKGWNLKSLAARLPWLNRDGTLIPGAPVMEAQANLSGMPGLTTSYSDAWTVPTTAALPSRVALRLPSGTSVLTAGILPVPPLGSGLNILNSQMTWKAYAGETLDLGMLNLPPAATPVAR